MAMRLSSMSPLFEFELEPLRQNADFILYRGKQHDNTSLVLVLALAAKPPSPQGVKSVSISRPLHFRHKTLQLTHSGDINAITSSFFL